MFRDLMRLVVQDLLKKKFSSFMTLFAISLGISAVFLITLVGMGFGSSVEELFEEYGANRIYVTPGPELLSSGGVFNDDEVDLLNQRPFVEKAYGYYTRRATITQGNEDRNANVIGVFFGDNFFEDYNLDFAQGREPQANEDNVVVFGSLAAEQVFSREVRLGTSIELRGERFRIIGILEEIGNPEDDNQIYFELDALRELYDAQGDIEMIEVVLREGEDIELAKQNIEQLLLRQLGDEDAFSVITPDQLLEQFRNILGIIQTTLAGIAFVSLIVGALGIINTMYVIVTEKTKDIGIMKSVGARNRDILFMFTLMAALFGFLGAILGIIFGIIGVIAIEQIAQQTGFSFLSIPIEPLVVFGTALFGIIIGVISGFLPSLKASKITIIETLRK